VANTWQRLPRLKKRKQRMYLREMGVVELLSREGEIAIAKRIEAGRDTMIKGLCESALTFEAIMIWREELAEGEILLRDIIDLEKIEKGELEKEEGDLESLAEERRTKLPERNYAPGQKPIDDDDEDEDDKTNLSMAGMEAAPERNCASRRLKNMTRFKSRLLSKLKICS